MASLLLSGLERVRAHGVLREGVITVHPLRWGVGWAGSGAAGWGPWCGVGAQHSKTLPLPEPLSAKR